MKIPPQLAGEGLSLATKCRRLPLLLPTPEGTQPTPPPKNSFLGSEEGNIRERGRQ